MRPASPANGLAVSGARQRPEHLHHEHALLARAAQAVKGGAQLTGERRHHLLVGPEQLRAHTVRDDAQPCIAVQTSQELANGGCKFRPQRIETDFHADIHACLASDALNCPQYCTPARCDCGYDRAADYNAAPGAVRWMKK